MLIALRWALPRAVAFEVACATLIAVFGFGGASLSSRWYDALLPATQIPGILLLTALGLCCGFLNSLVISDVIVDRWGGLTTIGAPMLFMANILVVGAALFAGRLIRQFQRRQRGASARGAS